MEAKILDVSFNLRCTARFPTKAEGVSLVAPKTESATLLTKVLNRKPAVMSHCSMLRVCILKAAILVMVAPSGYNPRLAVSVLVVRSLSVRLLLTLSL